MPATTTSASLRRRMAPEARRRHILQAAQRTVAAHGLANFSLEEVAAEAGVAPSLPRHYFGDREGLLHAVASEIIKQVVAVLGTPRGEGTLVDRLSAYLEILARDPWVHGIWMQAPERSADLRDLVRTARRRLAELSFDVEWNDLSAEQQLALVGWAGYFESVISGWVDEGLGDRRAVIATLAAAGRRLGVRGVA